MAGPDVPELQDHDGFIADLYHLLWQKNVNGDTCPGMLLPDLILYKYRIPAYWYFTALDGSLKRKSKASIVNKKIYADFTKNVNSANDVVAYHICEQKRESHTPETCIRYFDSKGLHDFLFHEEKLDDGCLQKFIQPKGLYNTMIQAAWSPQMCLLERRVNVHHLRSSRVPLLQRTATYDGDEHLSQITPVRGTLLADRIQQLCLAMVSHIKTTSPHRQTVSRLLLNFKCDADDNIWFLWCSSLRLTPEMLFENSEAAAPAASSEHATASQLSATSHFSAFDLRSSSSPVCLEVALRSPSKQAVPKAMEATQGVCPFSGRRLDPRHQYFVTYKNVIEYAHRMEDSSGVPPERRRSKYQVPPLLARVCPELTMGKYASERQNPLFLYKRVMVAEETYLDFSSLAIPGILPNPSSLFASKKRLHGVASAPTLPALPRRGTDLSRDGSSEASREPSRQGAREAVGVA